MRANGVKAVAPVREIQQWDREPGLGATYVAREYADMTVEMLASRGIVSEVIPDGRYFRVKVYPLPPKGTH